MNNAKVRNHLQAFDFKPLFIEELGWDRHNQSIVVEVGGETYSLAAVAEKRGMIAFVCAPDQNGAIPLQAIRRKIEHKVAQAVREHIIVYTDAKRAGQVWQWVRRVKGKPIVAREVPFYAGQSGDLLIQKLNAIKVEIEDEEDITLVIQTGRVGKAFDVEKVTKAFYDRFKTEHGKFLTALQPQTLPDADRTWYTSVMLNRLMFLYFIQKKGFLAGDENYLRNRLRTVQAMHGSEQFYTFYRFFLMRLFHDGLGKLERNPELQALIGEVPYLNGGLFAEHAIERRCREQHIEIQIEDAAFERVFAFFDDFDWHLDNRAKRSGKEINPDVLGYVFEKYINYNEAGQKENGAYYTKEDITEYISRSTILPYLLDTAQAQCPAAFIGKGSVWKMLRDNPDKYIFAAMKHGIELPLPADIKAGIADVSRREGWNKSAGDDRIALPTEIWREVVARRQRCAELQAKLASGTIESVNDLITYNLDIRQFVADIIADYEGANLIQALWRAIKNLRVLDPTVGSGAFLFAALNILEPLYEQCLERMETFIGDSIRMESMTWAGEFAFVNEVSAQQAFVDEEERPTDYAVEFQNELDSVNALQHPNRAYFIFKSIIVNNLFGVDIMEEATEICKLRLFLKLVAQVEPDSTKPNMGVEPLPDVDFNIRAGNTLVGYVNEADMNRLWAATGQLPYDRDPALADKVREYSHLLADFRNQQLGVPTPKLVTKEQVERAARMIRDGEDSARPGNSKSNPSLNNDLWNLYKTSGKLALTVSQSAFNESHTPLHWFVEFPEVMAAGGFDVIIGNPPYVEYSKVREGYALMGYKTEPCGNLYANVMERCKHIVKEDGRTGLIVPTAVACTDRMLFARNLYKSKAVHIAHFAIRPSKLFDGVDQRVSIVLIYDGGHPLRVQTTRYNKWTSEERPYIFPIMAFAPSILVDKDVWCKLGTSETANILQKIENVDTSLRRWLTNKSENIIYYKNTGVNHWLCVTLDAPHCFRDDKLSTSSRETHLFFASQQDAKTAYCILNSSLFFWRYQQLTNCRDFNPSDISGFPVSVAVFDENFASLADRLRADQELNSGWVVRNQVQTGQIRLQFFRPRLSKSIIDEIDRVLAKHYGFTDEELDFIINYDIKYRMGRNSGDED